MRIAAKELLQQSAFANDLTERQQSILDLATEDLLSMIESKKISMMEFVGFAIHWQRPGENDQPFEAFTNNLPDRTKALTSYLIANRFSKLKLEKNRVESWLEIAARGFGETGILKSQIDDELDQLRSRNGR